MVNDVLQKHKAFWHAGRGSPYHLNWMEGRARREFPSHGKSQPKLVAESNNLYKHGGKKKRPPDASPSFQQGHAADPARHSANWLKSCDGVDGVVSTPPTSAIDEASAGKREAHDQLAGFPVDFLSNASLLSDSDLDVKLFENWYNDSRVQQSYSGDLSKEIPNNGSNLNADLLGNTLYRSTAPVTPSRTEPYPPLQIAREVWYPTDTEQYEAPEENTGHFPRAGLRYLQ